MEHKNRRASDEAISIVQAIVLLAIVFGLAGVGSAVDLMLAAWGY